MITLAQVSNQMLNPVSDPYFETLYTSVPGYRRPDHFWEPPQWAARARKLFPEARFEVYTGQRLQGDTIAWSVLEANKDIVLRYIRGNPDQRFVLGGYLKDWSDFAGCTIHESLEAWRGSRLPEGYDYSIFQGMPCVPRLTMSTGCSHRCAFCTVEHGVRELSWKEIEDQVTEFIHNLDFELVYLNDKTFGQAANHAWLPDLGVPSIIQTTAGQALRFERTWLKTSGIRFVELGVESYNDPILKSWNKPACESTIQRAVSHLNNAGVKVIVNLVLGSPMETARTYQRTLNFLEQNKDAISHLNVYHLAVYPGTKLAETETVRTNENEGETPLAVEWERTFKAWATAQLRRQYDRDHRSPHSAGGVRAA